MEVEKIASLEKDKKNKDISEKEIAKEHKKSIEFNKLKEKNNTLEFSQKELLDLKELLEKGIIDQKTYEDIKSGKNINKKEISHIFDKIDQIESTKNVDRYLPKEIRITKSEYLKAMDDPIYRNTIVTKLNIALTMLSNQINPEATLGLNLFSGFLLVLDKNLIIIQENTIDIRNSLVENSSTQEGNNLINFFKNLFN